MKKLCIIPARGGSKRLLNKNTKTLNGKPLIFYTIDAALGSNIFDKIIFSSDDRDMIQLVSSNYAQPNIEARKRPRDLATDKSKVIDTIIYYYYEIVFDTVSGENRYDQIWQTLPTCPLRTNEDIVNADKLLTKDIYSVISITDVEFPPTLSLDKDLKDIISSSDPSNPWENGNSRSQDHPIKYRPNGAIYGMWTEPFEAIQNFYTKATKGYYMPRSKSIDIDTDFDFALAEKMLNEN